MDDILNRAKRALEKRFGVFAYHQHRKIQLQRDSAEVFTARNFRGDWIKFRASEDSRKIHIFVSYDSRSHIQIVGKGA